MQNDQKKSHWLHTLMRVANAETRLVTDSWIHLEGVTNLVRELSHHAQTMRDLINAGEKRRLGRVDQVKVKGSIDWNGKAVTAKMVGSMGDEYATRITIFPKRGHQCTCPDWRKRGRQVGPCKHVLRLSQIWLEEHVIPNLSSFETRVVSLLEHVGF